MDKKGAIELSMTTIIVIVIGITILSLGLVWVRSVFTDVTELSSGAFEKGETQIAEIFGQSKEDVALSPAETKISQGEQTTATLAIRNSGTTTISGVYAEVSAIKFGGAKAENLKCGFDDTGTDKTNTYSLESGESITRGLIALDDGSEIGTYICKVDVYNLPSGTKSISFLINID